MKFTSDVYERFPYLRRVIGDHGQPVKKVRPISSRFEKALDGLGMTEAYVIADLGWCRRELIPLPVDEEFSLPWALKVYFKPLQVDEVYWPVGLAMYSGACRSWVVNPFLWLDDNEVHPEDTLKATYTLDRLGLGDETYLPFEDIEYEQLRESSS